MRTFAVILLSLACAAQQPPVIRNGRPVPPALLEVVPAQALDDAAPRQQDYRFTVTSAPYVDKHPLFAPEDSPSLARKEARVRAALEIAPDGWLDTHVVLVPGDRIHFTATGRITLPDGRSTGPEGVSRGWKDLLRLFPLSSANTGSLIGVIGADDVAVPFSIGSEREMHVHQAGKLYLRINLSRDLLTAGRYNVDLHFDAQGQPDDSATPALALNPVSIARLPRRVADANGTPGDMVNLALLGTREQVIAAFAAAGWVRVDRSNRDAVLHGVESTLARNPYVELPMSTLYLFGRPQDLAYARANQFTVAAIRHHLRLWDTGAVVNGAQVWAGAATHDIGFARDARKGSVTHRINASVDHERDFVLATLQAAGSVQAAAYVTPGDRLSDERTATGEAFHTDGRIVVMQLR